MVGVIGAGRLHASLSAAAGHQGRPAREVKYGSIWRGFGGLYAARKCEAEITTTDIEELLADPEVSAVAIATRHDSHARLVCDALEAGKHVFVEKPMAIRDEDLRRIDAIYRARASSPDSPKLMVGFNRRFAPHVQHMKRLLDSTAAPRAMILTVNAGRIASDHWIQDPQIGGGRIVGEACHFVDLLRYLADGSIRSYQAASATTESGTGDIVTLTLRFENGSIGSVHYFGNGHREVPKERLEVYCQGRVLALDNFWRLTGFGWRNFRSRRAWKQDKGNSACVGAFVEAVRLGLPNPIPYEELLEVSAAAIGLSVSAKHDADYLDMHRVWEKRMAAVTILPEAVCTRLNGCVTNLS